MTCSTPGCYAKAFRRNLCRNHFYMWESALSKGSGLTERSLSDVRPAPSSRRYSNKPRKPWCLCETPRPAVIALFSRIVLDVEPGPGTPVECNSCGMPIKEYLDAALHG